MLVHNIQSLERHFNYVKLDAMFQNADIICLYESWLNENIIYNLDGFFILHRRNRSNTNKAQGSIIYLKKHLENKVH